MKIKRTHLHHRTRQLLDAKIISPKVDVDQIQTELFAVPTVTQPEIDAWLVAVPKLDPTSPRARLYIRAYDIAGKVARAKHSGDFHAILKAAGVWIEE